MNRERTTVEVRVPGAAYDVVIGRGLLDESGARLRPLTAARRAAVVSDTTVAALCGVRVKESLETSGFDVAEITVPPGETSKSWAQAGMVLEELAAAGLERGDVVVSLGGGVVGDLAGFAAATYLRGIDFVQLPTTLLAQVDSSVGGKTGVDLAAGKNLAGAFRQPLIVLADVDVLQTLAPAEWTSGLAELAKVAVLSGEHLLSWSEKNAARLSGGERSTVQDAVAAAVSFKANVVSADERESGLRECLNYGHTLGHAIERVAGYGVVPHGIAVAEGMRFAASLAEEAVGAMPDVGERQGRLLDALRMERLKIAVGAEELRSAISSDKKSRGGAPRFVLVRMPGEYVVQSVDESVLMAHLEIYATETTKRGLAHGQDTGH